MKFLRFKVPRIFTNGVLIIIFGLLHTKLALSRDGFGPTFLRFSKANFYKIHPGLHELPFVPGMNLEKLEAFSAFWFFYWGLLLIPLGLLIHSIERMGKPLPHYFTVSYLLLLLVGAYMIPDSGMTIVMLPHAVFMLAINVVRARRPIPV
jgi:hypothetical protein